MKHHIGHIVDYYFTNDNGLHLQFENGDRLEVRITAESGRVVNRPKVNSLTGIKHPGIVIGNTLDGRRVMAHNHRKVGRPSIAYYRQYAQGKEVIWDNRKCTRSKMGILQSALDQIMEGRTYSAPNYNCQTFVNIACRRVVKSESVSNAKAALGMLAGLFLVAMILKGGAKG